MGRWYRTATLAVAIMVAALATPVAAVGCSPPSAVTSTTLDPIMEAYRRAHPGLVDGPLTPAPRPESMVRESIKGVLGGRSEVLLPGYLPRGFALAAPYNGTGSGSAYPNPYVWETGYSVTYTDGADYLMVLCNPEDDLDEGEWSDSDILIDGRPLRIQRGPGVIIAATGQGRPVYAVAGGPVSWDGTPLSASWEDEVVRVAQGLRPSE